MKQRYEFPRILTRGNYDLHNGDIIDGGEQYRLFPKDRVEKICISAKEIVIFVHGFRNTSYGAKKGGQTLRRTLRKLGYKKHPVVSFSYDANVRGAGVKSKANHALCVGLNISMMNGKYHLSGFIRDLKANNPNIKIRLVGHSLGCDLIEHVTEHVESIHLFGSPVNVTDVIKMSGRCNRLVNYINVTDEVISSEPLDKPSCLNHVFYKGVVNRGCRAKDHRFSSYAEKLRSFP